MALNVGAWVRIDDIYGRWCSECGKDKLIQETWMPALDDEESAYVTSMAYSNTTRIHCIACDAIDRTTNSQTLASMIREWRRRRMR